MKATLTFTLPEDQEQFQVASQAQEYYLALWDMDQWLRDRQKYDTAMVSADEAIDRAREHLHEILSGRGLSLDVLS